MHGEAGSGRLPLSSLTQTNALAWLLDIRQRLNVSVDLVDDGLTPLLPASSGRARTTRRPSLDLDDEQLHPTILGSMRSLKQEAVSLEGINVVSTPIIGADGRAAGALLVSDASSAGPAVGSQRELARIGAWLAGAIDAHLANTLANHATDFQQLASLQRLLNRVAKSGSEPELVHAFIDAVAVWHDAEAWGYVRDLSGRFLRAVSLPGADPAFAPEAIADDQFETDSVMRLTPTQLDELGFHGAGDTLVARVTGRAAAEWMIVVRGVTQQQNEARLALYVDVLGRALTAVAGVESSQLTWAMLLHLMQPDDPPEVAAERAIDEVSRAMNAHASFALFLRDVCIFGVGPSADSLLRPVRGDLGWLALPVKIGLPYRAAIGVRRQGEMPLTRADEQLLQSAGLTLAFWLNGVVERLPGEAQRRNAKTFEQVVDERVADTLARGEHISVIVVSLGADPSLMHLAGGWIARIRALLRPSDVTGWLANGDIGILLSNTPAEAVHVVLDRIAAVLVSEAGEAVNPSIVTASRAPGSTSTTSILSDLRADA